MWVEGYKHTSYDPIDSIALRHRDRAVDNLERTFDLMFVATSGEILLYPYSLYPLVRAAIEGAALALWLLEPETKSKRVYRSLQLTLDETLQLSEFLAPIAPASYLQSVGKRQEKIVSRLYELKNTVGPLKQRVLHRRPTYTDILKSLSKEFSLEGAKRYELSSPFISWKICSAFVHGSAQLVKVFSDFKQVTSFDSRGVATGELTASAQTLATVISSAVTLIARLDERFIYLATHDHGGRPLV